MRTTKNISITMPPNMLKQAETVAKREGRTKSELIREALRRYFFETKFPIYSEQEITKAVKATRNQLWRDRYARKIKRFS